ncbi:MAG TPA: CDP-alcohol phosphatidyltransferase family protein [Thermodesulfobacteriota bacterium]|nr:CDP-alcohol phosphatidyltransferase family protein [Thermodesulfobacteriota bacterium]
MSTPEEVVDRAKGGKSPSASKLLGRDIKTWWILIMRPIEDYLIDKNVHPNVLTVTSLIVSAIAGLLFYKGWIFFAGIILLAGSNFDMLDGRIARAQGLSSEHGAFFDSCLDRFAEIFIYLGLIGYFHISVFSYVVFLILGATTMVSYTRARAEGLGVDCEVGMMQRTERMVYLGAFSVFNLFGNLVTATLGFKPEDYLLKFVLALILIFSSYTAIERMIHVMKRLKEREGKKRE